MPVESISFLRESKISFELYNFQNFRTLRHSVRRKYQKIQKINCSGCYKNWLLCSIWDICLYQWLQAISDQFVNLFIILCWQIAETKIIQSFKPKHVPKLIYISRMKGFSGSFYEMESETLGKLQTLGKTGSSFIGPYASSEYKPDLLQTFSLCVLYLTFLLQRWGKDKCH